MEANNQPRILGIRISTTFNWLRKIMHNFNRIHALDYEPGNLYAVTNNRIHALNYEPGSIYAVTNNTHISPRRRPADSCILDCWDTGVGYIDVDRLRKRMNWLRLPSHWPVRSQPYIPKILSKHQTLPNSTKTQTQTHITSTLSTLEPVHKIASLNHHPHRNTPCYHARGSGPWSQPGARCCRWCKCRSSWCLLGPFGRLLNWWGWERWIEEEELGGNGRNGWEEWEWLKQGFEGHVASYLVWWDGIGSFDFSPLINGHISSLPLLIWLSAANVLMRVLWGSI